MNKGSEFQARTWLSMAESMIQRMEYDKAEKALRKAVECAPKSSEVWIKLGEFLLSQNRIEEARSAFYRATEIDPTLDVADFDDELSGKSVEKDVDTSDLLNEGIQAMIDKQLYKARKRFERAIKAKPEHAAAWRLLGNVRVLQGDVKGAKKAHQKAAQLEPWSIKEVQLDDDLSRPLDENPTLDHTDFMIRVMMAEQNIITDFISDRRDKLDEAAYLIELALEEDSFQQEKWREYGTVLLHLGRFEESADAFRRALELDINDFESDFDYTIALYKYGVTKWRYVTEAEALAMMIAKRQLQQEYNNWFFRNYFRGFRDPDYYI